MSIGKIYAMHKILETAYSYGNFNVLFSEKTPIRYSYTLQ